MRRREIHPTQSGELRHIGDLEKLDVGTDASGTPLTTYTLFAANVRFSIDDWKPIENFLANEVQSNLSTRIRIRWRPGLEGSAPSTFRLRHVLDYSSSPQLVEYYDITGAIRDITLRGEIQLSCILRDAAGFRTGTIP